MNEPEKRLMEFDKLNKCAFDMRMLDYTYVWLNDTEILTLIDAQPVKRDAQLAWFKSLPQQHEFVIKGIQYCGTPIGAFGLKNLKLHKAEYWGYIGDKKYWGQGIGKWMMAQAIELAKLHNLESIYLKVLLSNQRAIKLYQKSGFILSKEKSNEHTIFMELDLSTK